MTAALTAFGFNCSLKGSSSSEKSSTDVLLHQFIDALRECGVEGEFVRAADFNIKPGVKSHEGRGDDWPKLRKRMLAADMLVIGSPIWLGQPSSIAKRVLERWMHSWMKKMSVAACRPMERSRLHALWAMRMARIAALPRS
jgi:multimeric flavodoxin WrbA